MCQVDKNQKNGSDKLSHCILILHNKHLQIKQGCINRKGLIPQSNKQVNIIKNDHIFTRIVNIFQLKISLQLTCRGKSWNK